MLIVLLLFLVFVIFLILFNTSVYEPYNSSICPWFTLLLFEDKFCGGVILNSKTILTCAHCLTDSNFLIFYDVRDRFNLKNFVKPSKIFIHENFDLVSLYNDIAIIKTESEIPFSSSTFGLNLPFRDVYENENMFVSGFGNFTDGSTNRFLKTLNVSLLSPDLCVSKFGSDYNFITQICAGNLYISLDICCGDSGSSLYCMRDGFWTLTGIVSYTGSKCGDGFPSVYTNVFPFLEWIKKHTL
jgi:trypsin